MAGGKGNDNSASDISHLPKTFPSPFVTTPIISAVTLALGFAVEHYHINNYLAHELFNGEPTKLAALVALVVVSACFLNQFLAGRVSQARSQYRVPIPFMYPCSGDPRCRSTDSAMYMTVVRGHENYLEFIPFFFAVLGGLFYFNRAAVAGVFGAVWVFSRFLYSLGYSSGGVNARAPGFFLSLLSLLGMIGTLGWVAISILRV